MILGFNCSNTVTFCCNSLTGVSGFGKLTSIKESQILLNSSHPTITSSTQLREAGVAAQGGENDIIDASHAHGGNTPSHSVTPEIE